MGVAILLVIYNHSGYTNDISPIFHLVRTISHISIEIFLFVSGLGIYYSLKGDSNTRSFYRKRLLRIMPLYIPIVLIFGIRYGFTPQDYVLNISTLAFWLNTWLFNWYVPSIVFLYLLSPWYMKIFNKHPIAATISAIIIGSVLTFLVPKYLLIVFSRIPIFVIGIYTGKLCYEKKTLNTWAILALFVLCIVGLGLFYTISRVNLELMFIVPFFVMSLCFLFSKTPNYKYPVLTLLGNYSLALYLVYDLVADTFRRDQLCGDLSLIMPTWTAEILILALATGIAYVYQRLMYKIAKVER